MATRFELFLFGNERAEVRAAGEEATREIDRIGHRFNFYDPSSELSKINREAFNGPVAVAGDLFELLLLCEQIHLESDGFFDPTVGPLMKRWGFAPGLVSIPSPTDIANTLKFTGWRHVKLDPENYTVQFSIPGVQIDLGGIAKGWALDEAKALLHDAGVTAGLIHGGTSSVLSIGVEDASTPWRVGIEDPYITPHPVKNPAPTIIPKPNTTPMSGKDAIQQPGATWFHTVELFQNALSVSAIHGKHLTVDEIEYGHIVDPRTGCAQSGPMVSVVTAPSAAYADGWSTAVLARNRQNGTFRAQASIRALCFEKTGMNWEIIQSNK